MTQEFQALLNAFLVLASAISFDISFTPPNGSPKSLPPTPSLRAGFTPEVCEWIIVFLVKYALPVEVTMYWLASVNEMLHNLSFAWPLLSIPTVFPSLASSNRPDVPLILILGSFFSIAGCVLKIICYRTLAGFAFELSKSPKLATTGPYSVVRHPAYTGTWLNFIGSMMVHWWVLKTRIWPLGYLWLTGVGGGISILLTRIGDEDALMKKQFGHQWERWSKAVKYKLIPGMY